MVQQSGNIGKKAYFFLKEEGLCLPNLELYYMAVQTFFIDQIINN